MGPNSVDILLVEDNADHVLAAIEKMPRMAMVVLR